MSEPPGQLRTKIPATGSESGSRTVISSGREVEQGARSMLLLVTGLFRLDVVPEDDTVQTILRNLSEQPRATLRFAPVGGGSQVLAGGAAPSTGRFGGDVLIGEDDSGRPVARLLVGSVCHLDRGVTSFVAQAILL